MTRKQYQSATGQRSTQIAIASFVLGTLLLLAFLTTKHEYVLLAGFYYVLLALATNLVVLGNLLYQCARLHNHRDYYGIKILLVLANIPIAFVYLKIIINSL